MSGLIKWLLSIIYIYEYSPAELEQQAVNNIENGNYDYAVKILIKAGNLYLQEDITSGVDSCNLHLANINMIIGNPTNSLETYSAQHKTYLYLLCYILINVKYPYMCENTYKKLNVHLKTYNNEKTILTDIIKNVKNLNYANLKNIPSKYNITNTIFIALIDRIILELEN